MYKKISIVGCGSWGMAIANHIPSTTEVELHHYRKNFLDDLSKSRTYSSSFEFNVSDNIFPSYSSNLNNDLIIVSFPIQFINSYLDLKFNRSSKILILSKGIDCNSLMLPTQILSDKFDIKSSNMAVISGPSHAEQVYKGDPTTLVAASTNKEFAKNIQKFLSQQNLRIYTSTDIIGVQLGGAMKNVIAIAAGIMHGLGLGENSISALITRGIFELNKLGSLMGSKKNTLNGLSGIGDLVATCLSDDSRNRKAGIMIAEGKTLKYITENMNIKAEGINTSKSVHQLSKKYDIKLPICEGVYNILYKNIKPSNIISELMERDLRNEF